MIKGTETFPLRRLCLQHLLEWRMKEVKEEKNPPGLLDFFFFPWNPNNFYSTVPQQKNFIFSELQKVRDSNKGKSFHPDQ